MSAPNRFPNVDAEMALAEIRDLLAFLTLMTGNQSLSGGGGGLPLSEVEEMGLHAILRHAQNLLEQAAPDL